MNVDFSRFSSEGTQHGGRRRPSLLLLSTLLLLAAASAAHVQLLGRRLDYDGPLLPLDHLFTLFAASALFLLCIAVGRKALRSAGITIDDPVEGIPYAAASGAAATGTVFLLAGFAGGLRPWSLTIIIVALAALSWSEWPGVRTWLADLRTSLRAHGFAGPALGFQAVLLLFPLMLALRPPSDWDALMYHLDVPAEYLASGQVYLPVDNLHAALVGPIQLLYVPLLAVAAPGAPAILNVLFAAVLPMAMLASASRFLSAPSGMLAAIAVWSNTTLVLVAATPRIDVTLCLFTFLGQIALLRALNEPSGYRYYLLAAALLGAGVGVKLHALAYILALVPMVVWGATRQTWVDVRLRRRGRMIWPLFALAVFSCVGVLASLPWLARNQWMVGAPFYPLLAPPRLPPWIASLLGTSELPASVDTYAYYWIGLLRSPFNLLDAFFAPYRLTIEEEGRLYFLSPLLLLTPLWLIRPRLGAANWLASSAIVYLLILLVPFPLTNLRYLLPAAVPLTLVAAHGLVLASSRLPGARFIQRSCVALALIPTALAAVVWSLGSYGPGHVVGTRSERDYLARLSGGSVVELRTLVQNVPRTGRILFLFDARGYGTDREVLQDNTGSNWPLLVEAGADETCLASTGITHLLVNNDAFTYYVSRGLDASRLHWPQFSRFENRCLEEVERTSSFSLYRVRRET